MKEIAVSGLAGQVVLQRRWFGLSALFYPRGRFGISKWNYHRIKVKQFRPIARSLRNSLKGLSARQIASIF